MIKRVVLSVIAIDKEPNEIRNSIKSRFDISMWLDIAYYKVFSQQNNWLSRIVGRMRAARCDPPLASVPSLVASYTYGSERAACRRNISPVKSLARPLRRTTRLACASRRAPTETRALLAQSNSEYSSRICRFSVGLYRLFLIIPTHWCRNSCPKFSLEQYLTFEICHIVCVCVCEKCMYEARPNYFGAVVLVKSKDGCHHKAACEYSKYRVDRMTRCKMGRFLSTADVCGCADEPFACVCVTSDRLRVAVCVGSILDSILWRSQLDVCFYYHMTSDRRNLNSLFSKCSIWLL